MLTKEIVRTVNPASCARTGRTSVRPRHRAITSHTTILLTSIPLRSSRLTLDLLQAFHHIVCAAPKVIIKRFVVRVQPIIHSRMGGDGLDDLVLEPGHLDGGSLDVRINSGGDGGVHGRAKRPGQ